MFKLHLAKICQLERINGLFVKWNSLNNYSKVNIVKHNQLRFKQFVIYVFTKMLYTNEYLDLKEHMEGN